MQLFKSKRLRRKHTQSSIGTHLEGADHWDDVGELQFEFLLREGLQPGHHLLDVGCGSFRGGRFLIDYLQESHYCGIDRDAQHLEAGIQHVLKPAHLTAKKPNIRVVEMNAEPKEFDVILGRSGFDYIWIHAVFDHISPDSIRCSLYDLSQVLCGGGRMYATIFLNPHGPEFREPIIHPRNGSLKGAVITYPDREYWHHTIAFFEEIVKGISWLELDACLYDYAHPLGLRMLRFLRKQ
jgi:SAM-dependent methyltransferase